MWVMWVWFSVREDVDEHENIRLSVDMWSFAMLCSCSGPWENISERCLLRTALSW